VNRAVLPRERCSIRAARAADADAIARIYNHYVLHTTVTFEEDAVAPDEIARRMHAVVDAGLPWLVAELEGDLVGYAYADKWKTRSAYRHSVESTVYLAPQRVGNGLGTALYGALIDALRATRTHLVIGGIALPNDASIALHERLGFVHTGRFDEVGRKFERWVDVGYWQLLLPPSLE
jgi:phosphinothricin acetyltransferase